MATRRYVWQACLAWLHAVFMAGGAHAADAAAAPPLPPIRIALIEGLSGPFANAGEAVYRNLLLATERVNQRGGVKLPDGAHPLELLRFDRKGTTEEALAMLRAALDALNKHNQREPGRRALLLNHSAVDPALTNDKCSFWHFRFDAHADMRLAALTEVLREDAAVKKVYLIGQDYSFGQHVNREAKAMLAAVRPDIQIVGDELHPVGRVKDFFYAGFRERFPLPQDDYVHARLHAMIELLSAALETARSTEATAVARALEGATLAAPTLAGVHQGTMRAANHQFIQPLVVSVMQRAGTPGARHGNEGSGYGFATVRSFDAAATARPTSCRMDRP